MKILVLNGGSSSLKATLFEIGSGEPPATAPPAVWDLRAEWGRATGKAHLRLRGPDVPSSARELAIGIPQDVLRPVLEMVPGAVDAVGHRVVHGGKAFTDTTPITPEVQDEIRRWAEFAPEHNLLELEGILAVRDVLGAELPQVAVFDTAFHTTIPREARVYPVPWEWYGQGIRRYGFHGISHQYASRRAAQVLGRPFEGLRLVTCHLGNGASLAAVRDGRSVDTTMGYTPLDGIAMGTRSGSIDPGILIYLVRHKGYGAPELDRILNKESGLFGISGISGDMRDILAAIDRGEERARLAFDVYTHRLCGGIGAMVASLGGLDALVFTAGIGENTPQLRAEVCRRMAFLGIELDSAANGQPASDRDLATPHSRVRVVVVRADEDWAIARECVSVVPASPARV